MKRNRKQLKHLTTGVAVSVLSLAAFGAIVGANADSNPCVTIDLDYENPVSVTTDEYEFNAETMDLKLHEGYSFKLDEGCSQLWISNSGTIIGDDESPQTLAFSIINYGTISGGRFEATVSNYGTISGGEFAKSVIDDNFLTCFAEGKITGGSFDIPIELKGKIDMPISGAYDGDNRIGQVPVTIIGNGYFASGDCDGYIDIRDAETENPVGDNVRGAIVKEEDGETIVLVSGNAGNCLFDGAVMKDAKLIVEEGGYAQFERKYYNDIPQFSNPVINGTFFTYFQKTIFTGTSVKVGENGMLGNRSTYQFIGDAGNRMSVDISGQLLSNEDIEFVNCDIVINGQLICNGDIKLENSKITTNNNLYFYSDEQKIILKDDVSEATGQTQIATLFPEEVVIPLKNSRIYDGSNQSLIADSTETNCIVKDEFWTPLREDPMTSADDFFFGGKDTSGQYGDGYRMYGLTIAPKKGCVFFEGTKYIIRFENYDYESIFVSDNMDGTYTISVVFDEYFSYYYTRVAFDENENTISCVADGECLIKISGVDKWGKKASYDNIGSGLYPFYVDGGVTTFSKEYEGEGLVEFPVVHPNIEAAYVNGLVPCINKITNVVQGVHIFWNESIQPGDYDIYRKDSEGNEIKIATVDSTVTDYVDRFDAENGPESGENYSYSIRLLVGGEVYMCSVGKSIYAVETPDILGTRKNTSYGISIEWNKIEGATGYAVYRWDEDTNGAWARVATIEDPSVVSWVDTESKSHNGTVFHYTVRALAGSDRKTLSGCNSKGRTIVRLFTPTISQVTKVSETSANIKWNYNDKAMGYEVRFMDGSTVVVCDRFDGSKPLNKTLEGLTEGKTYQAQVRSFYKTESAGIYYSAWSAKKDITM